MNIDESPMSWKALEALVIPDIDRVNGPTNAQATIRLFGHSEKDVRVTLYRDHHAWCPYCQKVWLWLEFKQIPYEIRKVTMRCYGRKEDWFLQKVPSGMLPALELDKQLITESDIILLALERSFGNLGMALESPRARELRHLERLLFKSWCQWLCRRRLNQRQEDQAKATFQRFAWLLEQALNADQTSPWLGNDALPGGIDLVFIPYVERMNASLAYYKGFRLRQEHPAINRWLSALETLSTYQGTQSDFHTHVHDLPPQMGGCWKASNNDEQIRIEQLIDCGDGLESDECCWPNFNSIQQSQLALSRVLRHRQRLMEINPLGPSDFDQPLRCALTRLVKGNDCKPNKGSASALRYLRDRISVPRDMPLPAARLLRQALEATASLDGSAVPAPLLVSNRYDQDPEPFIT